MTQLKLNQDHRDQTKDTLLTSQLGLIIIICIIPYLRIFKAPLQELVIQRCSQRGSPKEIRMSPDSERKMVAAQLGSYCELLGEVIPHRRIQY